LTIARTTTTLRSIARFIRFDLVAAQAMKSPLWVATELDAPRDDASPRLRAPDALRATVAFSRRGTRVVHVCSCEWTRGRAHGWSPQGPHRSEGERWSGDCVE